MDASCMTLGVPLRVKLRAHVIHLFSSGFPKDLKCGRCGSLYNNDKKRLGKFLCCEMEDMCLECLMKPGKKCPKTIPHVPAQAPPPGTLLLAFIKQEICDDEEEAVGDVTLENVKIESEEKEGSTDPDSGFGIRDSRILSELGLNE